MSLRLQYKKLRYKQLPYIGSFFHIPDKEKLDILSEKIKQLNENTVEAH